MLMVTKLGRSKTYYKGPPPIIKSYDPLIMHYISTTTMPIPMAQNLTGWGLELNGFCSHDLVRYMTY